MLKVIPTFIGGNPYDKATLMKPIDHKEYYDDDTFNEKVKTIGG